MWVRFPPLLPLNYRNKMPDSKSTVDVSYEDLMTLADMLVNAGKAESAVDMLKKALAQAMEQLNAD